MSEYDTDNYEPSNQDFPEQAEEAVALVNPSHPQGEWRTFFGMLCILAAILCLVLALFSTLDFSLSILAFVCMLLLAFTGVVLLERREASDSLPSASSPAFLSSASNEAEQEQLFTFEQLVEQALRAIPQEYHEKMQNLAVIVEDEPTAETLDRVGTREGHILLGLYEGVPLTSQSYHGPPMPERIIIYQTSIETICGGVPERIRQQVHRTVLHEVAHHFGISHEEMPIWVR